jgi:hypothetical protein
VLSCEISSQSLLTTFLRATFLNYTSRIDTVNRCIRIVISRPEQIVVGTKPDVSCRVAGNCIEYFTLTFALRYVQLPSFTVAEVEVF